MSANRDPRREPGNRHDQVQDSKSVRNNDTGSCLTWQPRGIHRCLSTLDLQSTLDCLLKNRTSHTAWTHPAQPVVMTVGEILHDLFAGKNKGSPVGQITRHCQHIGLRSIVRAIVVRAMLHSRFVAPESDCDRGSRPGPMVIVRSSRKHRDKENTDAVYEHFKFS